MRSDDADSSSLHISLLGPLDIRIGGKSLGPIRSRKEQWLIALLVLRSDRHVPREWLAETLWPDNLVSQSLAYLRRAVYLLRQALATEAYRLTGEGSRTLRFTQAGSVIDVVQFDMAIKRGAIGDLRMAVDFYRGPLLEGCDEEWVMADRQVREQGYVGALEQLAHFEQEEGHQQAAIAYLQRLILQEPLRESAHRSLMQAYADEGNLSAMITTYRDLRLMLRRELNADPDPTTISLYDKLRSEPRTSVPRPPIKPTQTCETQSVTANTFDAELRRPSQSLRRPLPRPLTKLIGREQDVLDVASALSSSRLVTLTGVGGVGKSRLAIHVAAMLEDQFRDGVCYVDLSGLNDARLIVQTISVALGRKDDADPSLMRALIEYLAARQILLVIDGCEHLIRDAAGVADKLLPACASITILATSQQPLGLTGEAVWRTPSLQLPPEDTAALSKLSASEAMNYAGILLFAERAATRRADFQVTDANLDAIVKLCARLDGIPLAIELAAARLTVLSVDQIAAKLDDRFQLLTGGSRTALPRQQTLKAALDWSYDLLDGKEQAMLRRLGAFTVGGSLEAIEALCADDRELAARSLDLLQQLVDKSFVWTTAAGTLNRYRLLETTRAYVLGKLEATGEMEHVRYLHCDVYTAQIETAWSKLSGSDAREGLNWFDSEIDNIRAVLEWLLRPDASAGDVSRCQVLIGTRLSSLWQGRIYLFEARYWIDRALARGSEPTAERARLELVAGDLAVRLGAFDSAEQHIERGMAAHTVLGDQTGVRWGMNSLGRIASFTGDYPKARRILEECLAVNKAVGDSRGVRAATNNLGLVALRAGDYAAARYYHEQCLQSARQAAIISDVGWSLDNLAEVYQAEGDLENARRLFTESLTAFLQADFRPGVADCLQGLGEVSCSDAADAGGALSAATLLGAAEQMREVSGLALQPADIPQHERAVVLARQAAGNAAFNAEWARGTEMSYEEITEFALNCHR